MVISWFVGYLKKLLWNWIWKLWQVLSLPFAMLLKASCFQNIDSTHLRNLVNGGHQCGLQNHGLHLIQMHLCYWPELVRLCSRLSEVVVLLSILWEYGPLLVLIWWRLLFIIYISLLHNTHTHSWLTTYFITSLVIWIDSIIVVYRLLVTRKEQYQRWLSHVFMILSLHF